MAQKEGLSVDLLNQHFEVCVSVLRFLTRKNYRVHPKRKDGSSGGSVMKTASVGSVSAKSNGSSILETGEGSKELKEDTKDGGEDTKETESNQVIHPLHPVLCY